jgi:DNA-binding transcriptional MerR regulator
MDEGDKQVLLRRKRRSVKRYNLTQTARILGVHRQTIYYWVRKGWIKSKRDYRRYPVFTVLDIENLMKWKNTINLK